MIVEYASTYAVSVVTTCEDGKDQTPRNLLSRRRVLPSGCEWRRTSVGKDAGVIDEEALGKLEHEAVNLLGLAG